MRRSGCQIAVGLFLAAVCCGQAWAQDASPEEQFKKACGTCHAAEANAAPRQGPNLWGVYGRASGQVAGFKYSDALAGAKLTWNDETLDQWLTNASQVVPGTTMPYRQKDPEKRKLIIAYLKTIGSVGSAASR